MDNNPPGHQKAENYDKYGNPIVPAKDTPVAGPSANPSTNPEIPGAYALNAAAKAPITGTIVGKKGRPLKHFEKLIVRATGNSMDGLQDLIQECVKAAAETIERGSPLTRKLHQNAKETYEIAVEVLSEGQVAIGEAWARGTVAKYAPLYLDFRVRVSKGQKGGVVKASTVGGWCSQIVVCIARYTHDPATGQKCGAVLLYREGLVEKLVDRVHYAVKTYGCDRYVTRSDTSCGLHEVRLLIEEAITVSTERGRLARMQLICQIIMGVACAARPSSLSAGCEEDIKDKKYLKFGEIRIYQRARATWDVQIDLRNHKGHNATIQGQSRLFWFRALQRVQNLLFDPWWIVAYTWARGALEKYKTLEDLLTTEDDELVITRPNEPFFVSAVPGGTKLDYSKPMLAKRLSETMKRLGERINIPDLTMYTLRRDFANDASNKLGPAAASLVLNHKDQASILTEHYSRGAGNLDLLGIRTGEASEHFLPGAESALAMRVRVGSAMIMLSKAIALSGQLGGQSLEEESTDMVLSRGDDAMAKVKELDAEAIAEAQEKACKEDELLHARGLEVDHHWKLYLSTFGEGSELYTAASRYSHALSVISKIKSLPSYKAAIKDKKTEDKYEEAEASLRIATKLYNQRKQAVRKVAKQKAEKELALKRSKSNIDTIRDKDAALEYFNQTSSLITAAVTASSSKSRTKTISTLNDPPPPASPEPGSTPVVPLATDSGSGTAPTTTTMSPDDRVAAINQAEEEEPLEDILASYKESLSYKPNNLIGDGNYRAAVEELLDVEIRDAEPPKEQPLDSDTPPPEWKDDDMPELIKDVSTADVRIALMKTVLDPLLFQRETEERIKADGKVLCYKCIESRPDAEPRAFSTLSNLKRHMWQQHTAWSDLPAKMKCGTRFMCPGACGRAKQFDSVDEVYGHCLSKDCKDQEGYLAMKAAHDSIDQRRYEVQKHKLEETATVYRRDQKRAQHLAYFASLHEEDLLDLAEELEVPREDVEPHLVLMMKNFHFVAGALLP
ncbi:hypothetical protein FS749_003948 [Ceratobasidium sp. UAMH 11750]|nr:hypothetical protein FS749_003948 [Ceratobasidium sp. UAMH 11750]